MKKLLFLTAVLMTLATSSCTINDKGEFELTWVFWVILSVIVALAFIVYDKNVNEAKQRGTGMNQLIREREKDLKIKQEELEKTRMELGLEVEYLGGIPNWYKPCKVNFSIFNKSIRLKKDKSETFMIPKEDIISISNEKSGRRSVGKTVAGALVGGVLTGGIGLIVGGTLGARRKDTSELYVTYRYNGVELSMHLKPGKNTDKVYAWINSVFA